MLGSVGQAKLGALLEQLAEGERKVEASREQLSGHYLFHPFTAFARMDRAGKGSMVPQDVRVFL
jgi:hypothetical protein